MADESRKFGAMGGKARAANLSKADLTAQAQKAAMVRWGANLPVAEVTGVLRIGDLEIPCAVLEDGTRVLTQAEMLQALGRHRKANVRKIEGEENVPPLLQGERLKPFISNELLEKSKPIRFRTPSGVIASGYRAEILPEVCNVYLRARDENALMKQQQHIPKQAEILIRGLATVGIIALVDEATGYQEVRTRDALAQILERFIAKELRPWVRTFPPQFYEELYRLKSWDYTNMRPNSPKPIEVGRLTDDIVYKRLAPGVRDELKKLTPRNAKGYLKNKLHQRLTPDIGNPKLREHLTGVVMLMKYSPDFATFMSRLDKEYPRWDKTLSLPFPEQPKRLTPGPTSDEKP